MAKVEAKKTETEQLWGQDGGHVGSITIDPMGGAEMAIFQINLTACGAKNIDFWLHNVLHKVHVATQDMLPTHTEQHEEES